MPATLHAAFSMHQPHIDSGRASMTFEETVETQFVQPVQALLQAFAKEGAEAEHQYFSGVLSIVEDKTSEAQMLAAIIELSRCAFLGFYYSEATQGQINDLLDYWIDVAHTMSADPEPH
ncbi:MAG TPA: hypothetical protein DCY55_13005 [Gammaproteobacteria bacterium]|nr:hypothetical protein [Gammaproteobacteria bacterium]